MCFFLTFPWLFQSVQNSLTFPWLENAFPFFQVFQSEWEPWQSLLQKTWPARSYFPQRKRNSHISILSRLCQKSISYQGAYVLQHKGAAYLTMLIMKFLCAKDFLETSWRFSPPLGHPVSQLTRTCEMKEKLVFHVFSWYLIKSRVQFRKQTSTK